MREQKNNRSIILHPLMRAVVGIAITSVIIFAIAMMIPPEGEVHKSILEGLAILTAQMAIIVFAYAVVSGRTATFTHGSTTATVGRAKRIENENNDNNTD